MLKGYATVLDRMITYFEGDVRRIQHSLKVYGYAKAIGHREHLSKKEQVVLELAAILHDIGIKESEKKYHSSSGRYQEIEGPPVAKQLLTSVELDQEILDRVLYLIGHHHSYQCIEGQDFQILVEADFLVNIYEEDMAIASVESIHHKIFKTKTGKTYLQDYIKYKRT